MQPELSIIIPARGEGRLGHQSMRAISAVFPLHRLAEKGIEIIVVHIGRDRLTREVYGRFAGQEIRHCFLEKQGDLDFFCFSVAEASGRYLLYAPGGHLAGQRWLDQVICSDTLLSGFVVPEYEVCFGADQTITRFFSSSDPRFDKASLMEGNCWSSGHFAGSRTFLAELLAIEELTEDTAGPAACWSLFCAALSQGAAIEVIADTAVYFRKPWHGRHPVCWQNDVEYCRSSLFDCAGFAGTTALPSRAAKNPRESKPAPGRIKNTTSLAGIRRIFQQRLKISPGSAHVLQEQNTLPAWLEAEILEMNALEPLIGSDLAGVKEYRYRECSSQQLGPVYEYLCRRGRGDVDYVFLVPWLITGGADLVTLRMIQSLARQGGGERIVVIATENIPSTWAHKLPDSVRFIPFGCDWSDLPPRQQDVVLNRFLLQARPEIIHNINSLHGYRLFIHNGRALQRQSRLLVSLFCFDRLESGARSGYAVHCLPDCYDFLESISSDNRTFLHDLQEKYGYDTSRLSVLYQPYPQQLYKRRNAPGANLHATGTLHVLWAGRLDRQKRPDILLDIIIRSRDMPVHFHVHGGAVLDEERFTSQLRAEKNVTCHGSYDGFAALPIEEYDVFLYTSQWDGIPNVLLDAAAAGLPLVASAVGGIHELITHEVNGFLIDPYDDSSKYVSVLQRILEDPAILSRVVQNMDRTLNKQFSPARFDAACRRLYRVDGQTLQTA